MIFIVSVIFVQLLIEHGANIDTKNKRGETPLHVAVGKGKSAKF